MENKIEIKDVLVGYNERIIEHKNEKGEILYTEHIKEPIYQKEEILISMTEQEIKDRNISKLKQWFDTTYRCQVEQATRAQTLGDNYIFSDRERNKIYNNLMDIYNEGKLVQSEIRNLTKTIT